jgi:hypothetical protein
MPAGFHRLDAGIDCPATPDWQPSTFRLRSSVCWPSRDGRVSQGLSVFRPDDPFVIDLRSSRSRRFTCRGVGVSEHAALAFRWWIFIDGHLAQDGNGTRHSRVHIVEARVIVRAEFRALSGFDCRSCEPQALASGPRLAPTAHGKAILKMLVHTEESKC